MAIGDEGPVVVIGAGLAGLACAQHLSRSGRAVLLLEASDGVGGRVRTDAVDGFRCDRGFQLLNPAYPVLPKVIQLDQLDLRPFRAGVVVAHGSQRWLLADPRREPHRLVDTLRAPIGTTLDKLKLARWAAKSLLPLRRQLASPDRSLSAELDAWGVSGILRQGVVEPFLSGVLGESDGATSARLAGLLVRSFLLGTPAVPSLGMARLPELIADSLPAGVVQLGTPVRQVSADSVRTDDEQIQASAVVVATDPATTARLTGLAAVPCRALTTFWHTAPEPPTRRPYLHIDADARGPVVNTAVVTNVAPSYAPAGRPLIASTVLGADDSQQMESSVRRHLELIYGSATESWRRVAAHAILEALPAQLPPLDIRQPVTLTNGVHVAGDHRDTASIQGALVSGRRAAVAVLAGRRARV